MAHPQKDKKLQDKSERLVKIKRYTTRQVMELTEKRRQQMDEEARQRKLSGPLPVEPSQVKLPEEKAPLIDPPAVESASHNTDLIDKQKIPETSIDQPLPDVQSKTPLTPDGTTIVKFFRPMPEISVEESVADSMQEEFNKTVEQVTSVQKPLVLPDHPTLESVTPPSTTIEEDIRREYAFEQESAAFIHSKEQKNVDENSFDSFFNVVQEAPAGTQNIQPVVEEAPVQDSHPIDLETPLATATIDLVEQPAASPALPKKKSLPKKSKKANFLKTLEKVVLWVMEGAFIAGSFMLFGLMMVHLLKESWGRHYYDQGPFVLLMSLALIWLNRKYFVRRKEWFWGSTVSLAGGLGVFIAAAMEGSIYICLGGFLITCFSLFLWRYREPSACRLIFPLLCLMFIIAPPVAWEQATIAPLNKIVFQASDWMINSLHIPTDYDGTRLHMGGGLIYSTGDPTVFRSIAAALVLGCVCMTFQSLSLLWSLVFFGSVIFWAVAANVLRVTTAGLMLENLGVEYAFKFFTEYSAIMMVIVIVAGLALTSGLLPHKEEFE